MHLCYDKVWLILCSFFPLPNKKNLKNHHQFAHLDTSHATSPVNSWSIWEHEKNLKKHSNLTMSKTWSNPILLDMLTWSQKSEAFKTGEMTTFSPSTSKLLLTSIWLFLLSWFVHAEKHYQIMLIEIACDLVVLDAW